MKHPVRNTGRKRKSGAARIQKRNTLAPDIKKTKPLIRILPALAQC
jgi:hypothetical protein